MKIEEILIIKNGNESYGISTHDINQISRVPMLMPLPLRPSGVRGLCVVSGNIVCMVDMNLLLDMSEVDYEADKSRLLSLNGVYSSNAILVSEVYNTVEIEQNNIEYINKENDPIIAIYKYKKLLVQIISLNILISNISRVVIESKDIKNGKVKVKQAKEEDSNKFLIFSLENEKFALNIEYLREIVLSDIQVTEIAGSASDVLGLITLREELLLVVDLRIYYDFKTKNSYKNRILVASCDGKKIGLLVDEIIDIKSYLSKDIEYMSENFQSNKISGVIHDTDSLISFFDRDVLEKLFAQNEAYIDSSSSNFSTVKSQDEIKEVIVFKLAGKEYAFDVESVAEIIDIVESTKVAFTSELIDGIINIRGQVITIVSLFKKLNIEPKINHDSKIIICNIKNTRIGFIVDSVSDILNIKTDEIREQDDKLFPDIFHLNNGKRLVLSIDLNEIFSK
ncbi:MAG: chemotaxis protein CheW [Campylobacterales bacterium]|nr:chemotaxis protein CheW [Campylobacterales bacterium]